MTREETLDKAKAVVTKDRNDQYGLPESTFGTIAGLWSAYLGRSITRKDVAVMMILLKCARTKHKVSDDTWIDIAGYAACGAEVMEVQK